MHGQQNDSTKPFMNRQLHIEWIYFVNSTHVHTLCLTKVIRAAYNMSSTYKMGHHLSYTLLYMNCEQINNINTRWGVSIYILNFPHRNLNRKPVGQNVYDIREAYSTFNPLVYYAHAEKKDFHANV